VHVLDDEGQEKFATPIATPSNPGGLAFSPNGKRLAISHYNGVSLYWMNAKETAPTVLNWKGSHLNVIWTPDGKSVLTSTQENALHGWQLADSKEMRMQGYIAKVRSMNFTPRGKYLATSGTDQIICWPFSGGGPWGKPPVTLGGVDQRLVTQVASHPKDEMVAAGYSDGMIVLAPLDGRMEVMIHPPSAAKNATVNGLVWNAAGDALFASTESGTLLLFTIESVRKALVQGS
jgi:WD40 repeat protein